MKYLQQTFTLPAANKNVSQIQWDLAFLSAKEFITKYDITPADYRKLKT